MSKAEDRMRRIKRRLDKIRTDKRVRERERTKILDELLEKHGIDGNKDLSRDVKRITTRIKDLEQARDDLLGEAEERLDEYEQE